MPQRVRNMFGRVLLTMTPKERADVNRTCMWSRPSDVTDAQDDLKRRRERRAKQVAEGKTVTETFYPDEEVDTPVGEGGVGATGKDVEGGLGRAASESKQLPSGIVAEARKKRQQEKREADLSGRQYGVSNHAVDDDDMWGLLTETMTRTAGTLPLAPVRTPVRNSNRGRTGASAGRSNYRRPSTAPTNPFSRNSRVGRSRLGSGRRAFPASPLSVGFSSPSFFGGPSTPWRKQRRAATASASGGAAVGSPDSPVAKTLPEKNDAKADAAAAATTMSATFTTELVMEDQEPPPAEKTGKENPAAKAQ